MYVTATQTSTTFLPLEMYLCQKQSQEDQSFILHYTIYTKKHRIYGRAILLVQIHLILQ